MKTCTNGLKCPTSLQCGVDCYFNEADLPPVCCSGDCNQGRACPARNAPIHIGSGGNTVAGGFARPQKPAGKRLRFGLVACALLWLAAYLIHRLAGLT